MRILSLGPRRVPARGGVITITTRLAVLAALLAAAPDPTLAAGELTGRDVIARMQQARALGGDDAMKVLRVTLIDRDGGERSQTVATYQKLCGDASRNLILFRDPPDVAGAALLTWARRDGSADMWLYLPEVGRIRQMNPAARGESFMGSDLTYEDVSGYPLDVRMHRLLGDEEIDGRLAYKVESIPTAEGPYGRVLTWVDRQTFLPVRIKYYEPAGTHLKTGRFGDVRRVKDVPTLFSLEMHNVQTGHRTRVVLLDADYQHGLACERLTRRYLTRGP